MRIFRNCFLLAVTALIPCSAAVIYQLTGTSSAGTGQPYAVDFTLTQDDFIATSVVVQVGDFDTCNTGFETCSSVAFDPVSPHDAGFTSLEFNTTTASTLFFFDLGALGAEGVYDTVFGAGTGTLTVTQTQVIPEPGSVALLLSGSAALLLLRRYRRG